MAWISESTTCRVAGLCSCPTATACQGEGGARSWPSCSAEESGGGGLSVMPAAQRILCRAAVPAVRPSARGRGSRAAPPGPMRSLMPQSTTMCRALRVACCRSEVAPVVTWSSPAARGGAVVQVQGWCRAPAAA